MEKTNRTWGISMVKKGRPVYTLNLDKKK